MSFRWALLHETTCQHSTWWEVRRSIKKQLPRLVTVKREHAVLQAFCFLSLFCLRKVDIVLRHGKLPLRTLGPTNAGENRIADRWERRVDSIKPPENFDRHLANDTKSPDNRREIHTLPISPISFSPIFYRTTLVPPLVVLFRWNEVWNVCLVFLFASYCETDREIRDWMVFNNQTR